MEMFSKTGAGVGAPALATAPQVLCSELALGLSVQGLLGQFWK